MSALHHSDSPNETLDKVLEIINKLAKISADGNYIYRGERKRYGNGKISSSLYRQYQGLKGLDIEVVQKRMVKDAEKYTTLTDEHEILSQIQHFGGDTNLIDFTTDYLIALFFACDGAMEEDGRLILLQNSGDASKRIWRPHTPENRVIAQKSVFVQPKKGYLEQDEFQIINIPHSLKKSILEHLRKSHGISRETIYNDLHGYIKNQETHKIAYVEFFRALTYQYRSNNEKAIEHYTKAIELKPDYFEAYDNRGIAYCKKGDFEKGIQDHSKAIELKPDDPEAYNNRGVAYLMKGDFEQAIQDCTKAIEIRPDLVQAYHNRGLAYRKKGDFEQAIQDYTKAIELKPDDPGAYNSRGVAYYKKGDFEQAIQDYTKAIELKPDLAQAYNNRGIAYLMKGDRDRAQEDLKRADALAEEQGLSDLLRRIRKPLE